MRLLRSLLFAPANRPDLIEKFLRYEADAYAIDLEDGTPEAEKDVARRDIRKSVAALRDRGLSGQLFVRTNELRSKHAEADLAAALDTPIDGILLPKLAAVEDLRHMLATIAAAEERTGRALGLIGLIETAVGVLSVEELAREVDRHVWAFGFGAEDFMTDLGGRRTAEGLEVLYARSRVVLAARAAGIQAIDQVFVGIRDADGFLRDAVFGRQLGYTGKMCVTPSQAAVANDVYAPSPEEIERSRRLIDAYESAQASGRGVIEFAGQMVDEPLLKRAQAVVRLAAQLGHRAE
jgi:citrate lyase subunit beta/citryl-CoA lyase